MRRVDEESVGRLRVDDQSIRLSILADGEDTVDCFRCGGEAHHALRDEASDELHILRVTAGDARATKGCGGIERLHLRWWSQQGVRGVLVVRGGHVRGQHAGERDNVEGVRQRDAVREERHDWRGLGGETRGGGGG